MEEKKIPMDCLVAIYEYGKLIKTNLLLASILSEISESIRFISLKELNEITTVIVRNLSNEGRNDAINAWQELKYKLEGMGF